MPKLPKIINVIKTNAEWLTIVTSWLQVRFGVFTAQREDTDTFTDTELLKSHRKKKDETTSCH